MYELSRVRLHSVGPKGARYQDVTIDLRDVGGPVPRPAQRSLFDVDPRASGGPRRPSPATVLFLENGGGKTVLMKLIFSVMLPGRRNVLGSANSRVLEDYVLARDLTQVVLEWQHTRTGERVVTGKACEWRGHVVSSDPGKLSELWYAFRPTAVFNLDTLPLTVDGRLLTLAGFRDRLSQANRAEPKLQAAWETSHREWTIKLDNLGLDPELFRYQRAMNAGEGEAADAFSFKSDEAFVDFLLRAVTDEQDPQGLAEVLTGYAAKLAQRGTLLAEREFVAGALDLITPLATAAQDATAARDLASGARREAERLATALAARHRVDAASLQAAERELGEIGKVENLADQEVRRLGAVVLELRRLVAKLRLEAAEHDRQQLEADRGGLQALVAAWLATEKALAHRTAHVVASDIRHVVEQREEKAKPALQARNQAARAFARALLDAAERAATEQTAAEERASGLEQQAAEADQAAQQAARDGQDAQGRLEAAGRETEKIQAALRAAVHDGILTAPEQVANAAQTATHEAGHASAAWDEAVRRLPGLTRERKRAEEALAKLRSAEADAAATARARAGDLAAATRRTAALAGVPRLAELLGTATVRLETDTDTLTRRLRTTIAAAEEQRANLQVAQTADERVLQALGTGGLLPPSTAVTQALAVLEAQDITAWAGWRYLAQLPNDDRDRAVRRYPHLVDGLVLNNPNHLAEANRRLTQARLLPAAIVAVGSTAGMQDLDGPAPAGMDFIVPPNPALYDEQAAEQERQHLTTAHAQRANQLSTVNDQLEADRRLAEQLRAWREDLPPGKLDQLDAASESAAGELETAKQATNDGEGIRDTAAELEDALQQSLPDLEQAAREARALARRLTSLAEQAAELPTLTEQARIARDDINDARHKLKAAEGTARRLRQDARSLHDKAGDHRRAHDASIEELGGLTGAGSVDKSDAVPTEPVPELRARHRAACDAYLKVEVGADLLGELRTAEETEASTRAEWEALGEQVRDRASQLLNTTDGIDAAARAAATARTRRELDTIGTRIDEANTEIGKLQAEYNSFTPQDRSLEPYGKPRDIPHGEDLIARAGTDHTHARDAYEKVKAKREILEQRIADTRETVRAFAALLESLADVTPPAIDDDATPFPDTVDAARTRRNEARQTLTEAEHLLAEATTKVRSAADGLAQYAVDPRFDKVSSPVRRQIIAVNRETLPEHAEEWRTALRPRLRTLDDDLAQINEHRSGIITRLHGMVDTALGTLRLAQRLSKLPAGMGDWSGQEFLRIRFTEPDPAVLREYLGTVVDDAADTTTSTDKPRRSKDGLGLVLQGVRAATPKGVVVELLKPDAVLRTERVRVASISDVFSGGQLLTAAIILYCTMAALRANERGHAHRPHAGVLFLDNPIGRASAGYLLELQLSVAAALGVQLIYTTGLFDTNALSVFPLVVRLRNDADLRAGLKYLSIDSEMRRSLEDLDEPDDTGRLTATRIYLRPHQTTT